MPATTAGSRRPPHVGVTGAAGGVGSRVVRRLLAAGARVTALVRDPARVDAPAAVRVDYDEPESIGAGLAGLDALVFIGSDGHADRVLHQHLNVVRAVEAAGTPRVVLLSSQDADPRSPFCYAPVYADTERWVRQACAEPVIVRAGLYAEFHARWIHAAAATGVLAVPTGAAVAPITRDDVAHCLAAAVLSPDPPPLTTVTGPEAHDLAAQAALAERVRGARVRTRIIAPDAFLRAQVTPHDDPWWAYAFTTMFASIDQDRFARVTDDVRALTGREPTPFATCFP